LINQSHAVGVQQQQGHQDQGQLVPHDISLQQQQWYASCERDLYALLVQSVLQHMHVLLVRGLHVILCLLALTAKTKYGQGLSPCSVQ